MAKGIRVDLNKGTLQEYLDGDHGVRADLVGRAGSVLASAKASAPVDTGAYRDGLHIFEDHTDRLAVHVGSSAYYAWVVEARTGNLAGALDAAGGS